MATAEFKTLKRSALAADAVANADAAIAAWTQVLAVEPDDLDAHKRLADLYIKGRRKFEAEPHLRAQIGAGQNDLKARKRLAAILEGQGDTVAAEDVWQDLLAHYPDDSGAHERLADLLMKQKRLQDARPHLLLAAEARGDDLRAWKRWARCVHKTAYSKPEQAAALDAWRRVLAIAPGDLDAHKARAVLLWRRLTSRR